MTTNEMAASLKRDGSGADEIANILGPDVEQQPIQLRWGLDDVQWGDDDSVIVMLSGPDGEPYWLELDQERAAVLRQNLAGPDGEEPAACAECGHPHDAHQEGDDPVSPGRCAACPADDAWHDYAPATPAQQPKETRP